MGFVKSRLGVMMFLQYAIWGVWLPILSRLLGTAVEDGGLGFSDGQIGTLFGFAASIGAITAPFICGLADRHFSAQRFLAVLLVLGGIVKYITAQQTEYTAWLYLSILYSILYMPTISLTNSICFANIKDTENEFPRIRFWGTIGWIAASWIFPWVFLQHDLQFQALPPFLAGEEYADATSRLAIALQVSGIVSILYAGFAMMLPNTPPKKDKVESIAFVKAFALLKRPSILWLVLASLPIAVVHQIYFLKAGPYLVEVIGLKDSTIGPAMTVGQVAELAVIAFLGVFIKRLGFRTTLAIGCMGYVLRYAIWGAIAMGDDVSSFGVTLAILSQGLHGFCFACFFAAAYIYIDHIAEADIRVSAQAVFGVIILGIGPVFSGPAMVLLANSFGDGISVTNYAGMWFSLSALSLVTTIALFALFRDERDDDDDPSEREVEAEAAVETP